MLNLVKLRMFLFYFKGTTCFQLKLSDGTLTSDKCLINSATIDCFSQLFTAFTFQNPYNFLDIISLSVTPSHNCVLKGLPSKQEIHDCY